LVDAEKHFRSAIPILRRCAGPENSQLGWVIRLHLRVLAAQSGIKEARPLALELLELRRNATLKSPNDAYLLNCYARELLTVYPEDLRDTVIALETARRAYDLSTDQYHYNRFTLAQALRANGHLSEALDMFQRAIEHAPLEHSTERAMYEGALSALLGETGDPQGAERVYRDTLDRRIAALPADHVDIAQALASLGRYLLLHGRIEEAESHLSKALQIRNTAWGEDDWRTQESHLHLAVCLSVSGRAAEAERMLREVVSALSKLDAAPRTLTARAKAALDRIHQGTDPRSALDLSDQIDTSW
jgi:tetratricopeptide (TPR) repeat protein